MPIVRDFAQHDVSPANAATNWYIEHTAVHFASEPSSDDQFDALWRRGSATHPWLAAEVDGRFAGYAKAAVWRERAAYRHTCETGIYVARGMERRGVGLALYTELLPRLRAAGFRAVIGGMTLPNDASAALHERAGFRKVAHFERVGFKFGRWHDVGFWQLVFPDAAADGLDSRPDGA
ncbi:MAG: N-acetyltransferase family protein [Phycisphaerales bacterium]|jgi:L-amino acid N-acyltransferase YncA